MASTSSTKLKYRYLITAVTGELAKRISPGEFWIDEHYFGLAHTWTIIDLVSGDVTNTVSGKYVGRYEK